MNLQETEVVRSRWRRALDRYGLADPSRPDFASVGLCRRLRDRTVQLLMLPSDPDLEVVRVDSELWTWLEQNSRVEIGGGVVDFGDQRYPTARGPALVSSYGRSEPWNHYLALHRTGSVEAGLGTRGGWEYETRSNETVRVFALIAVVGYAWALLKFTETWSRRSDIGGPWLFSVALQQTGGALLGNVGNGWAEPTDHNNTVGGCTEEALLWHIPIPQWPDEDGLRELAFSVGDRVEDAWGCQQRRYFDRQGDRNGLFNVQRLPA